ncbi:MAG: sigma-70 family RNA polymerase sigma factor [Kiritimatiellae bacterium]|nr:sigma-70 family RNA polymerase sigma factor [Kiritimatiellia bacterium]
MNASDAEIVARCREGDTNAFTELVRRNQDSVFNLVWSMTGNWHEAADIAQETFIRAFRKLHSYKPEFSFRNWVMSIGANLTRNRFRSFSRRRRMEETLTRLQEAGPPPAPALPDEGLEAALAQMPETLRTALLLKHVEGQSYEEIARTLGIGLSAAKMRVARGRDELVHLLKTERERES